MAKNIYLLSNKNIKDTISIPMLEIEYIQKDIPFEIYDIIIFTSKSAVYSISSFNNNWKQKEIFCIAQMTANEVEKLNVKVSFTGSSGHGNDFANEIINTIKNINDKKVLYLRGDKVVSNLVEILRNNGIYCDQEIIYKTVCKKYNDTEQLPKNSIIIFSSPSTITCFLKNYTWDSSFHAISIGNTTAKYFPEFIKPSISQKTTLKSCVELALLLAKC